MDMTGEVRIPASRDVVWAALNNPAILKACIPGCEELNQHSATEMTAVVVIKIGPVSARFNGAVTLSELDPPNAYRITGEGQGGVAGHARGGAVVKLTADGADSILSYTISAQVGGKLAQLGSRMIDATAKTLSATFFKNLEKQIQAQNQGTSTESPAARASDEKAPAMATAAAMRPAVPAQGRTTGAESGVTAQRIAIAALVVAAFAVVLAWLALNEPGSARSALQVAYTSPEFNLAVQLLIVLTLGYLLGRSGLGGRSN